MRLKPRALQNLPHAPEERRSRTINRAKVSSDTTPEIKSTFPSSRSPFASRVRIPRSRDGDSDATVKRSEKLQFRWGKGPRPLDAFCPMPVNARRHASGVRSYVLGRYRIVTVVQLVQSPGTRGGQSAQARRGDRRNAVCAFIRRCVENR